MIYQLSKYELIYQNQKGIIWMVFHAKVQSYSQVLPCSVTRDPSSVYPTLASMTLPAAAARAAASTDWFLEYTLHHWKEKRPIIISEHM